MNNENEFMTVMEFANKMRIHPNTVRKAIKDGRIQAVKVGAGNRSQYRISSTELGRIQEMDMMQIIERIVEEKMEKRNEMV